jgi:hypothetical protein
MLKQSGARACALALGRAHFGGETVAGGLLSIRCHGELQLRAEPNVFENGIFVRSPEFVTFIARHRHPVSGFILSAHESECRTFPDCRSEGVQLFSFHRVVLHPSVKELLV